MFLAEARRVLDYHWRRADSFERKALGILTFTGVIVALLSPNLKVVLELHGHYRDVALGFGGCALVALGSSAVASAGALWARESKSTNVEHVRSEWQAYLQRTAAGTGYSDAWQTAGLQRELVEMLLHGMTGTESPIQSMCKDADRRGRWFIWGVRLNLAALLLILAVTVTTTVGSLDGRQQPSAVPSVRSAAEASFSAPAADREEGRGAEGARSAGLIIRAR